MDHLSYKQQEWLGIMFMLMSINTFLIALRVSNIFIFSIIVSALTYYLVFTHIIRERLFHEKLYIVYFVYLLYIAIHLVYGFLNAHIYWHYKNLIDTIFILLVPFFALLFSNPSSDIRILGTWKHLLDPKYLIIFMFFWAITSFHMMFGPDYFLFGVFIFWLPKKWRFIIGALLLTMIFASLDARSQVLKGLLTVAFAFAIYFNRYISLVFVHIAHWFFYGIAILFLVLGFTGVYNVLNPDSFVTERSIEPNQVYGKDEPLEADDLMNDTRTGLIVEVITSAIENDYVIFGRSPARGNDTELFAKEDLLGEYVERSRNEFCHLNIFTWIGLVGMLVYSFFYIQASYLGLYRTKNVYTKYFSVLIAFHWAYGWIEDCCEFNMMNVALWMLIGICLSPKFRSMSETEFELWFKSIFVDEPVSPYQRWVMNKELAHI